MGMLAQATCHDSPLHPFSARGESLLTSTGIATRLGNSAATASRPCLLLQRSWSWRNWASLHVRQRQAGYDRARHQTLNVDVDININVGKG